jgi:glutathione S-transferase
MITSYAFRAVPPFAQGLVRDLRVRWALEEVGLPYRTTLVGDGAMPRSAYRKIQPFGQIPAIEDGNLVLFESGAIVLHIAERFPACCPMTRRAHATQWMFAALNTIEGRVQQLAEIDLFHAEQPWATERRPVVVDAV